MQLTGKITRDSLMSLEAYSKYRKQHKAGIIAHRKLRSVIDVAAYSSNAPSNERRMLVGSRTAIQRVPPSDSS